VISVKRIYNMSDCTEIELQIKDHEIATDLAEELLAISMYKDVMPLIDALKIAARHIKEVQGETFIS